MLPVSKIYTYIREYITIFCSLVCVTGGSVFVPNN